MSCESHGSRQGHQSASVLKDMSHNDSLVALVLGSICPQSSKGSRAASGALSAWQHVSQHSSSQQGRYTGAGPLYWSLVIDKSALLHHLSLIIDAGSSMT